MDSIFLEFQILSPRRRRLINTYIGDDKKVFLYETNGEEKKKLLSRNLFYGFDSISGLCLNKIKYACCVIFFLDFSLGIDSISTRSVSHDFLSSRSDLISK